MNSREARKRIRPGEAVPLKLSEHERDLIINKTLAGPNLADRIRLELVSKALKKEIKYHLEVN